LLTELIHY